MPQARGGPKICGHCEKPITGRYITAMDRLWCENHFVCKGCEKKIEGTFYPKGEGADKKPYCKSCAGITDENDPSKGDCSACGKALTGSVLTAMGKKFHKDCFVCTECKQSLQGQQFYEKNGKPFCQKDFESLRGAVCAKCNKTIGAGQKVLQAMDKEWHTDCFKCDKCKGDVGSSFYVKNNMPICEKCK